LTKCIVTELLESILMHVTLVVFYVLQLLSDISFTIFFHLCETVKIKVRNIQCYMFLFVSETWFFILRNECTLRAFDNVVMRKLNSVSEEVMERFHVFTK
jgi:hypothetical protein